MCPHAVPTLKRSLRPKRAYQPLTFAFSFLSFGLLIGFVFVSNKKGPGIIPGPQRQDIDWRLTHQCIGNLVRNAIGLGPVAVLVALALKIHIDILRLDATDGIHHQLADLLVKLVLAQT